MKQVEIFTDGACSGNPGPGGWGAILRYGTAQKELSGGEAETTNNRMELSGVIAALSALKEPCVVELTTDSKYVVDSITKGWVYGWQKKNWIKSDRKPALNVDLWKQLLPLLERHQVHFHWVKGHAGHPENERCDALAVMQRDLHSGRQQAVNRPKWHRCFLRVTKVAFLQKLRYNIDIQSEIDYLLEGFADGLTNRSRLQGNPERKGL